MIIFLFQGSISCPYPYHSHNDENSIMPLYGALNKKFASIEIDFFDIFGHMLVGHNYLQLSNLNIMNMYIKPLINISRTKGIYDKKPLYIFLDFKLDSQVLKNDIEETYDKLEEMFSNYPDIFTEWYSDYVIYRSLAVILTGIRPKVEYLLNKTKWIIALDSFHFSHLKTINPIISLTFDKINISHISNIVSKVHLNGQLLRIWDQPVEYNELLFKSGIDFISIDL